MSSRSSGAATARSPALPGAACPPAALGHERFDVVGHDIGMWIGYAIAADFPGTVMRLVAADALVPGLDPTPPLYPPVAINDLLWHFALNRAPEPILRRLLDYGSARAYHEWQFATKASTPQAVPREAIDVYWLANSQHDGPLHAALNYYRAIDETSAQNRRRRERRLDMPVLAIGGALAAGEIVAQTMRTVAADVRSIVLPDIGHYVTDEDPEAFVHAILPFLRREEAAPLNRSTLSARMQRRLGHETGRVS